jgi:hypothetical protein
MTRLSMLEPNHFYRGAMRGVGGGPLFLSSLLSNNQYAYINGLKLKTTLDLYYAD